MTTPAPEKAAPIPADVWFLARGEAEDFEQVARQFREYEGDLADDICNAIASAIMQDRADRASQEERIREDEREPARFPAKAAYARAMDVADRLIERAYGIDTPDEWNDAFRDVQRAVARAESRARQRGDAS